MLCTHRCDGPGIDAMRDGLRTSGWAEGGNLHIEYRAAGGRNDLLPRLAQELIDLRPALIIALNPQASRAAKEATATVPIVFVAVADPVRVGLVDSLARPGGNVTGVATLVPGGFTAKSLELLTQAMPKARRIAVLLNPDNEVTSALFPTEAQPAARQLDLQLEKFEVRRAEDIERAVEEIGLAKVDALWVMGDPIFHNPAQRIPDLVARARLPTTYLVRELVVAGGLMSYGPDFIELSRRVAFYVDRILKGARPADLPVEQPTRFRLVINLKTARTLGITIPQSLLLRADEVIP